MYFLKGKRLAAYFTVVETTKQLVILNAKRERIRNTLKRERIATAVTRLRNDEGVWKRLAALALLARNDKWDESRKVNCNDG